MRIGFDGRYAQGDLVGVGKYIKSLITELDRKGVECVVFYSQKPKFILKGKNIKSVVLSTKNRYVFEQIALPKAIKKEKVDLYHALGNIGVPLLCPVPAILTVHDIIPLEINDYFSYSPIPQLSKFSYKLRLKSSLFKASRIVTVSNYVKRALEKKLDVSDKKIQTIYSGRPEIKMGGALPENLKNQKYVLNHGGIDIRKNLDSLIKAFAIFHKKYEDVKLVVTGNNNRIKKQLENILENSKLRNSVIFSGYVDEKTLGVLIKSAALICYPTLSEGFGFPILEGFGAGVPVISSNTSAIPEVAGKGALLINPKNINEIADAMDKVFVNKTFANNLVLNGKARYNMFDWKKSADEYLDLYKSVLK